MRLLSSGVSAAVQMRELSPENDAIQREYDSRCADAFQCTGTGTAPQSNGGNLRALEVAGPAGEEMDAERGAYRLMSAAVEA